MKHEAKNYGKSGMAHAISACLSFLLILSMTSSGWAVVFSNPASITINDATAVGAGSPYPANVNVSGMTGNITNVTVTLNNITSTFPDDLDVLLVAPGGNNLILLSDAGGSDDVTNTYVTFDDAAAATVPDGTRLLSGSFKPTNIGVGDTFPAPAPAPSANTTLAAAFNGIAANGTWSLYVVDDLGVDMSVVGNGWSMTVTTDGTAATIFSNGMAVHGGDGARGRATPYASTINASGLIGAITDVNVTLTNVNHLNPDDLDIILVGPSGKRIFLTSDAGGTTDVVGANLTFDDAAAAGIPDAGPMVTGSVRPTNFGTGETVPDMTAPYPNPATASTATLASVFNGTEGNGTWSLFIVDDVVGSAGTVTGGWSIDITAGGTYGAKRFTSGDFEGDGRSDVAVYRSSDNNWWSRSSTSYSNLTFKWGAMNDVAIPADYDGDRKTDYTIFRPSIGQWITLNSGTSTVSFTTWGVSTDKLVPADYDGDGKVDVAVWRASTGVWYVRQSSNSTLRAVQFGSSTDIPVRGHFNGTDGADFAVFRPSTGEWWVLNNATTAVSVANFGVSTDTLAPGDYDGDGKTDFAVFRGSSGDWYILQSSTGGVFALHWGQSGDMPVTGDYDGDSKSDISVWRPSTGTWFLVNSGMNYAAAALRFDNWGVAGDTPIETTYLPQ